MFDPARAAFDRSIIAIRADAAAEVVERSARRLGADEDVVAAAVGVCRDAFTSNPPATAWRAIESGVRYAALNTPVRSPSSAQLAEA